MSIINGKCGTDCNTCQFKEKFNCGGCDKQEGKIFWGERPRSRVYKFTCLG